MQTKCRFSYLWLYKYLYKYRRNLIFLILVCTFVHICTDESEILSFSTVTLRLFLQPKFHFFRFSLYLQNKKAIYFNKLDNPLCFRPCHTASQQEKGIPQRLREQAADIGLWRDRDGDRHVETWLQILGKYQPAFTDGNERSTLIS